MTLSPLASIQTDSIFALSSAQGRAAIAIIRISGPDAIFALQSLSGKDNWQHGQLQRCQLKDPKRQDLLDDAMAVVFFAPRSFTGEDLVELHIHGAPATLRAVLSALESYPNLKPAQPGEFSKRALFNNKMDLIQVESLGDLLSAKTERQRKQALMLTQQKLPFDGWRAQLINLSAQLSAMIDFPDEPLEEELGAEAQFYNHINQQALSISETIAVFLRGSLSAAKVRDGVQIVLAGAPNAGKSTLLNALLGRDAAIVSEEAGTTRDLLRLEFEIAGIPVTITDTAGLRTNPSSAIEAEGIRRSLNALKTADLFVWIYDASTVSTPQEAEAQAKLLAHSQPQLFIANKMDLCEQAKHSLFRCFNRELLEKSLQDSTHTHDPQFISGQHLCISASHNQGLTELFAIIEQFCLEIAPQVDCYVTQDRQRAALSACQQALIECCHQNIPELKAESLRLASDSLGRLTGKIDIEELLDQLFLSFCIGK